jgi:hypothetical protein
MRDDNKMDRESDYTLLRLYLHQLLTHVDCVKAGVNPEHDLDIMSDALVELLADLGYQPEDFE